MHMGVKGGLKHKKRLDISKITIINSHLQKQICSIYEYKEKYVCFKKNIKNNELLFQYNIRAGPMLGISYVSFRRIPCSCYASLSKLGSLCNGRQYKYNQDQYTGKNQQCVYCPILGSYNNF